MKVCSMTPFNEVRNDTIVLCWSTFISKELIKKVSILFLFSFISIQLSLSNGGIEGTFGHQKTRFSNCMLLSQPWDHLVIFFYWIQHSRIGVNSFFNWDSLHARLDSTMRHGVTRTRSTKRLKHTGHLFRKNLQLKGIC